MFKNAIQGSILLLSVVICAVMVYLSKKGRTFEIRRLAALDGINEGVARCAETDTETYFRLGGALVGSPELIAPMVAAMSILDYTTHLVAKNKGIIVSPQSAAILIPVFGEIMYSAYTAEGCPELYNEEHMLPWWAGSRSLHALMAAYILRNRPGAVMGFGHMSLQEIILFEAGSEVGAICVGGTQRSEFLHVLALCDYALVSDELIAAGAYLSGDPLRLNIVVGSDIVRAFALGLLLIALSLYVAIPGLGKAWLV